MNQESFGSRIKNQESTSTALGVSQAFQQCIQSPFFVLMQGLQALQRFLIHW